MQRRRARKKQTSSGNAWVPIALIGGAAIIVVVVVVIVSNIVGSSGSSLPIVMPGPTHSAPQSDATAGQDSAPATLVEYFRFDCSHCADFALNTAPSIAQDYVDTGKLRIVFHPLSLASSGDVLTASEAALCAGEQSHYWDYHDLVFANFSTTNPYSTDHLNQYAKDLGLDTNAFNSCLDSGKYKDQIVNDTNSDISAGINSTPTFYLGKTSVINSESAPFPGATQILGAQPYSVFKTDIDKVLAGQ